jgi:hypothetical protein
MERGGSLMKSLFNWGGTIIKPRIYAYSFLNLYQNFFVLYDNFKFIYNEKLYLKETLINCSSIV